MKCLILRHLQIILLNTSNLKLRKLRQRSLVWSTLEASWLAKNHLKMR